LDSIQINCFDRIITLFDKMATFSNYSNIRDPEVAEENNVESSQPLGTRIYQGTADVLSNMKSDAVKLGEEIRTECFSTSEVQESLQWFRDNYKNFIFVPYFPAFHSPGWLLRYVVGPHNRKLLEQFFYDFWAGVTVALTLIPQVKCLLVCNLKPSDRCL
jgi:hypothetical protein